MTSPRLELELCKSSPSTQERFSAALNNILELSVASTHADYGTIHLLNADKTALELVAHRGFENDFSEHFEFIPLAGSPFACSRAANAKSRIIIENMECQSACEEEKKIARQAPFRSGQSSPLLSAEGQCLGVLSTYYRMEQRLSEHDISMLNMYVLYAVCWIEYYTQAGAMGLDESAEIPQLQDPHAHMAQLEAFDAIIEDLPFFSDMSYEKKAELLKVASVRHLHKYENLFQHGDPLTHIYWVCQGAVNRVRMTPEGRELMLKIAIAGDVLGAQNALQEILTYNYSAQAIQDSVVLAVPSKWMLARYKNWDYMAKNLLQQFATISRDARIEVEHQAAFSAVQNIACYLQHLCVLYHFNPCGFTLPYSKKLIASRLGIEVESLSRSLPKLRAFGLLVKGKYVFFNNLEAVQDMCCSSCSVVTECMVRKTIAADMSNRDKNINMGLTNGKSKERKDSPFISKY